MTRQVTPDTNETRFRAVEERLRKLERPVSGAAAAVLESLSASEAPALVLSSSESTTLGLSDKTPLGLGDGAPGNGGRASRWDHEHPLGALKGFVSDISGVKSWSTDGASITYTSVWGINAAGEPYYDANGAAPGEDALLIIDELGGLKLVQVDAAV